MSTFGPTREVSIAIGPSVNALKLIVIWRGVSGLMKAGFNDIVK